MAVSGSRLNELGRAAVAEAYGTFLLTLIGPGTIIAMNLLLPFSSFGPSPAQLGFIGLAHGVAVMVAVYSIGHVTGAHINPAVTVAAWATHRLEKRKVAPYLLGQFVGATIAGTFLLLIWSSSAATTIAAQSSFLGSTVPNMGAFGSGAAAAALFAEVVGAMILIFTIFGATDKSSEKSWAGGAIGLVLAAIIWAFGSVSGASINPARSWGPALLSAGFSLTPLGNYWIYLVGPILGGLVGGFLYDIVR